MAACCICHRSFTKRNRLEQSYITYRAANDSVKYKRWCNECEDRDPAAVEAIHQMADRANAAYHARLEARRTTADYQRALYLQGRGGDWTEADHRVEDYLAQRAAMEHPLPTAKIREQIEEDERTIAQWQADPPLSAYGRGVCEWLVELNRIRREALTRLEFPDENTVD